jgi:FdhD protein
MNPGDETTRPGAPNDGAIESEVLRFDGEVLEPETDQVVVEEPLEIRVSSKAFTTLMRTPGDDRDLALGLLYAEGVIDSRADIGSLFLHGKDALADSADEAGGDAPDDALLNTADLLHTDPDRKITYPSRLGASMSSCGVCGKRSISEAMALTPPASPAKQNEPWLSLELIVLLPERMKPRQELFQRTGALHAAGIFDREGELLFLREDIGRHNAVDKAIGAALQEDHLPLSGCVLQVSGRVSFEIVQKAYRAGIPAIASVSGVSSLAINMARTIGMTLAGFVREGKYCLYSRGNCLLNSLPPG